MAAPEFIVMCGFIKIYWRIGNLIQLHEIKYLQAMTSCFTYDKTIIIEYFKITPKTVLCMRLE
jgi:hypothetical protein